MKEMEIKSGGSVDPAQKQRRDEQLKKACKEFESVFTNEMLKSMRRTVDKCDLFHGGSGEEIYESLLDQELSKRMAGTGPRSLAETLYRQLKSESGVEAEEGADADEKPNFPLHEVRTAPPMDPLPQGQLSSAFGWRKDPIVGERRFHYGVDIAAPQGTPVRAPAPGKVVMSGFKQGYGNMVVLDHGAGLKTLYAHNQENKVKEGEWVNRGTALATVGSTGRSTGPHLHFEVRKEEGYQDPQAFLGHVSVGEKAEI